MLSVAAVIGRDFDLDLLARATKTSEDELLDILDAAVGRGPGARTGRRARALQLRPRPHPAHAVRGPRVPPAGRGRTDRWPKRWRTSAGTAPGAGWANWPATGSAPPNPSTWPRPSATPARRATPPSLPSPPPTPCATTPRPSTSTPRPPTPIPSSASTWPSGSVPPSARRGTPPFATPFSTLLAGLPISATPSASWPPPWPTTGVTTAAVGAIDAEKVEILEMALDRLSSGRPRSGARARHLVFGTRLREPPRTSPGPGRRGRGHRRVLW